MQAKMYKWSGWITDTDPETLYEEYQARLLRAGFKILDISEHHFEPFGYTALFLLAESHFAIHTFPEEKKTYLELTSCVKDYYKKFMREVRHGKAKNRNR